MKVGLRFGLGLGLGLEAAYQIDAHGSDDREADADGGGQLLGG